MHILHLVKLSGRAGLRWGLPIIVMLWSLHGEAQQYTGPTSPPPAAFSNEPQAAHAPSLVLPRFEMITGLVLMTASMPVGAFVAFAMGPPLLSGCGGIDLFGDGSSDYDAEEQAACERSEARQSREAAHWGAYTGLAVGLLGTGLMIHGVIRTRRVKAARRALLRPVSWSVQPTPQRGTATLQWRF